jgi:hypothetical protein
MTPDLHTLLTARLAIVREDLDEVIGRLSDELLPWAPSPGMRTIGGQLEEIAGTEVQAMAWLTERRHIPYNEAMEFGERRSSLRGLTGILAEVREGTLAHLNSLSTAELEESVPFPDGWFEGLRLPHCPRAEAFRSLAMHEWYHVGQLVSYLWARGDDPYKW